jgi:serine/threonine-protein kinase
MSAQDEDLARRAQARIGTVLNGKYTLDKVLGIGAMAAVYKATHRNGKEFALKLLHPELSLNGEIRSRFLREGYVANQVKHPGAVAVLDDDIADGSAFLVMELLEGRTVEELWEEQGRRLPLESVFSIGYQLLDVLSSAHENGVVHRDIKPANLFLTHEGRLKVLDFGIARVRDVASSHATQTGALMGTPAFMSPEQAAGKTSDVDGLSDVWSAGATLFTLASGELVHDGDNAQQIMIKAATLPARSLSSVLSEAPREVVHVIDRALAFEKRDRWRSAAELRDAIRMAYGGVSGQELPISPSAATTATAGSAKSASTRPSLPGQITEQPVAGERANRFPAGARRSLPALIALAAGLVVIGLIAIVASTRERAQGAPSIAPTPSEIPPHASAPVQPAVTLAPLDTPTLSLSTVGVDQLPTATPAAVPSALRSPTAPSASTPKPPAVAPATPAKPGCSPPYVIDPATGTKKWKMECL